MTRRPLPPLMTAALLVAVTLAPATLADVSERIKLHGFLSQAAFHTSDNNFYGDSDDGVSLAANEAGLNLMLSLTEQLRLNAQAIARNAGEFDTGEWRTDLLSLDWRFWQSMSARTGVRVGRVRNPYGLYNETRDVAHTRPSIYVPNVIYLEQARDVMLSRDGFALYGEVYNERGSFALEVGAGEPRISDNLVKETLLSDAEGVGARDPRLRIARFLWESPSGDWRAGIGAIALDTEVDFLVDGDFELDTTLLSLQYSTEAWQLTFEYLRFNYDLDFGFISRRYPGEGAYLQYTRFLPHHVQVFARYEYGVFDRNNRHGESMREFCDTPFVEYCYPTHMGYRRDAGVGVRWDINTNWMTAFEVHWLEGTMGVSYLDNPNTQALTPHWTLVGVEVAFRF